MSNTYKWAGSVLAVVLIIGGIFYWQRTEKQDLREIGTIKIGAIYAQTGPAAKYGEISLLGVNDAVEYFKTKNSEIEVALVAEDSQGDPKQAVSGATKLATIDQIGFGVVGTSAVSAAVAPIADQYQKLFISDAALYGLTKDKQYLFQNFMPSLGNIAKQINENKAWQKVAIVYINDDFGQVWSEKIKLGLDSSKKSELFSFDKAMTDFRTDAFKIKNYKPDILVVVGYGPALNQALADINLNKINKPIINYLACTLPGVLSDKRFNLEGQYSYEYPEISNKEIKDWMLAKNRDLNTFYTLAFDNTLLALNVAKDSGNDPQKAVTLLRNNKYPSLWGEINFAGQNSFERELVLTKIIDGKCSPVNS